MPYLLSVLLLLPRFARAAAPADFKGFVVLLLQIIQNFITMGIALIILGILYAVVLYMMNSDSEEKREKIKGYLVYAVAGLAVVMGMWGLVELLSMTVFGSGIGIPRLKSPA